MTFIKSNYIKILFFILFLINFYLLFPGSMTPDSYQQLQQAISGDYGSHHPPLMAFWWRMMMKIYNNPASMLLFHLALLWGSCYNFYLATKQFDIGKYKWSLGYFIIPFLPWIMSYSGMIWKDVSFAYGCLFAASLLTRVSFSRETTKPSQILFIILIIFYGTAAKYVGIFIIPLLVLWLTCLVFKNINNNKIILITTLASTLIFFGQMSVERLLVKNKNQTFSWQYVKLYDLAGISVDQNKALFPEYIIDSKQFSFEAVKKNYNNENMNPLFQGKNYFIMTKNHKNLDDLWYYWFKTVIHYPNSYFKHRFSLSSTLIKNRNFSPTVIRDDLIGKIVIKYINYTISSTKFKHWGLFIPFYIVLGIFIRNKTHNNRGKVLIFINIAGLILFLVLLQFSLGSDARYLAMPLAMLTFSHPIALGCIYDLIKRKNENKL